MKKLFPILIFAIFFGLSTQAKTYFVGKGREITKIQKAIDLAKNGDTIMVDAGLYKEKNIIIQKSITLIGINHPVLDGENKYAIITIKANNAKVEGFKIQHTGRSEITELGAIMIYDSYKVSAVNNILDDNNFGIFVQNSKSCTIKNNSITAYGKNELQSGNGIHCWHSDSLIIVGNKIKGHRDGLYFEFVKNTLVWRNISTENVRYGIHFMFSNHNTYIGNIFEKNEAGVAVMYSANINMYNNYFLDNWGDATYGILLKDIRDSNISGNNFTKNTIGLYMEACSRINLYKNIFKNNGWAVKIQASCEDNDFTKNNFIGNTFDIGTNGSLVLNTFTGNYWDKYEGYDLNKDNVGDVPYHPVSMYAMIIDSNPAALMLFRSLIVTLLDKTEKLLPGVTPENLKDNKPVMRPLPL
ncbi:nitrous oxide reductase family maturation protein NosD [Pedobacter changchengzhani]|uniref:Nitrous oxide reductase family maturation protein NosD n=1 Tax=Pedobacter changchengzhani TaxID=2529274 RepID=A0A4R5MNQ7_9SPHI|nr:nitrous oxide reductase family maturation protein NosD [Pedobacter changchengzhani]TDG37422.1 nitrous oxide reductase family maturation protein NosD [Pedobacter changchengzhani]